MKIGFFGTPEIAAYSLKSLHEQHDILFVVTMEDKGVGRKRKIIYSPVKEFALDKNLPVLQPSDLKDPLLSQELEEYEADIYIVVAYGKFIPEKIFNFPEYKTINLHPSLLPKYRGAAPVESVLINGEKETGITIQLINKKMDAGDIILQEKIILDENINSAELYSKVLPIGAKLLSEAITFLTEKNIPKKQIEEDATFCSKIDRETAHIDWGKPAKDIHNLIRGLNPKPAAWTIFREKNIKIWRSSIFNEENSFSLTDGEIIVYNKKRLLLGTGENILEILELQPENKKAIDASAFINGYRLQKGKFFK